MVQFDVTAVDAAQAHAFATIMSGGLTGPAVLQCLQQVRLLVTILALMGTIKPARHVDTSSWLDSPHQCSVHMPCLRLLACLFVCMPVHLA